MWHGEMCILIVFAFATFAHQEWDIRNAKQIEECVRHSDVVYNLASRDWETRYVICSEAGVSMLDDR